MPENNNTVFNFIVDNAAIVALWWSVWNILDDILLPFLDQNKVVKTLALAIIIFLSSKKLN